MFEGSVTLRAEVVGIGRFFPSIEFNSSNECVERVTIESPDGTYVECIVHAKDVIDGPSAVDVALSVAKTALDRLAFGYRLAIENARLIDCSLHDIDNPVPIRFELQDFLHFKETLTAVVTGNPDFIKVCVEAIAPPGEKYFGLFRSALISTSRVEGFMLLYTVLLTLFRDDQADVDAFILTIDPKIPYEFTKPSKNPNKQNNQETLFSRLRNELSHVRQGVDMEKTKAEIELRWEQLRDITQKAITLHTRS